MDEWLTSEVEQGSAKFVQNGITGIRRGNAARKHLSILVFNSPLSSGGRFDDGIEGGVNFWVFVAIRRIC